MSKNVGAKLTASVLGIDTNARHAHQPPGLEDRARAMLGSARIYSEEEPTVGEWFRELIPTSAGVAKYVRTLFPAALWLPRYNVRWLLGDFIAGMTIGLVVVPQAMAYAVLAGLTPAYGLYTSFTGAILYWVFGTSKDIVIGTTAVGSLLVGQVVDRVRTRATANITNEDIAHTLSLLCGITLLFFGLCRLGWIIEFIPYVPISAFVTAASITIMTTQIPTILGISAINRHAPPYRILIDTAKALPQIKLDAAIGLSSIVLLWSIREFCSRMEARQPTHKRAWTIVSSLRLSFTMLLFMLISFLVHGPGPIDTPKFRIVGLIERGFQEIGVPTFNLSLVREVLTELPAVAIILVIEHIAIAKAMGRRHNYTVDPSQEIVALGAANLLSPFVGGYVCTGSFGASAVLSKAGVRTPLAGLFSALMLILALYVLTGAFYYIPRAALSGLIIHAVCNLITPPKNLYNYWQLSPAEFLIWIACVAVAMFHSLDYCIYLGVALSVVLLLVRVARANGGFVGVARSRRVLEETDDTTTKLARDSTGTKDVFLQFDRKDSANPAVLLQTPYPGVFVYRLHDSFNYINQALHVDILQSHLMENTKRTSDEEYDRASDRLWNDAGPRSKLLSQHLPHLRALVLDFSAVNNIDITSVQGLIDLRNLLDRYAAPDSVEWHFANVQNRWARRALARAGFGYPTSQNPEALAKWKPIYSIAPIQDEPIPRRHAPSDKRAFATGSDEESQASPTFSRSTTSLESAGESSSATISAVDRPFFHLDLHDAVDAAVRDARHKDKTSNLDV